jgi:glycosyltransferase involved in cell wall biosynthesis
MPSTGEGFGIVFLEAAAYGLPVIGGNRDGSVDALADGAIGRPVDPEDEDALVAALVDALKGAQRGSSASVKRFAFENFAHHVDDLVRSLAR